MPDSSASAVVLFDKGHLRVGDDLQYFLDRQVRIKIIRPEGYKWATIELDYNEEYNQEIEDLEAVTYTSEGDHQINEHEVDDDAVFEEEIINDWNRLTFTFPSLKPGCIIEYKYTLKVGSPDKIPEWYFDRTIPVKWSELRAEIPSFLKYTKVLKGVEKLDVNEVKPMDKTIGYTHEIEGSSYLGNSTERRSLSFNGNRFRWVMKDRAGIPDLPFMTTPDDYKARIAFQLSEFNIPNQHQEDIAKNWSTITDELLKDEDFGPYLKWHDRYQNIISSLQVNRGPELKRVRTLFSYVANTFSWDGMYGIYGDDSLDDLITSQSGSGAELNLLLTGLLRQAAITAYPVLVSTRDHGFVSQEFVLPNQFNHVIVLVKLEAQELLLDATGGNRSLYLLPEKDLNGNGLVVQKSKAGHENWASLVPLQNTVRVVGLQAEIKPDGALTGKLSGVSSGYFAFKDRKLIDQEGEERFFGQTLFNHIPDRKTSGLNVTNKANLDSTLKYSANLYSSTAAETQVVDSTIYLDATPIMKWDENPLQLEERRYPVDFPYPYSQQLVITYSIPEGYEVAEYPDKLVSRIANDGGMFTRIVQVQEDRIVLRSVINLGRSEYSPSEYDRLKLFFDQIVEAHSEKIVLQKSAES